MLARATTFTIHSFEPRRVLVEVDVRPGLPNFVIVGLGDAVVRESRQRIRAAVQNSGFEFPQRRVLANLAPAHLRKVGPGFDLAVAVTLLAASGQVPHEALERFVVFGELTLAGDVCPVRGALAVAEGTRRVGIPGLIVAREQAAEASLVGGVTVAGVGSLAEVVAVLTGEQVPPPSEPASGPAVLDPREPDLADVRGHQTPGRALVIAAAGGHNIYFEGPPGTGKTMLARRLPSILPPLDEAEALEVTRIASLAGVHPGGGLVRRRPFRAPHHTISPSGLVGGGRPAEPGEVTLAHRGVLFLDELPEFSRGALEALRQPLEDGRVWIMRGQRSVIFPSRFMLVAASNPCPCGFAGTSRCVCGEAEIGRYRRRLSGPLLDRIDLMVSVLRPSAEELATARRASSRDAREAVTLARERQARRLEGTGFMCNGELDAVALRRHGRLSPGAVAALEDAYTRSYLSTRGQHRIARVARTIADLEGHDRIERGDLLEAVSLRQHDASVPVAA
jgi:magnesium chelatase family protein